MEGAPNDGTSADPAMTPIERQMQVIATSIQDLARETSRQNQELWQAIRKGPPTPHDNNHPPPRGGNRSNDQEVDSHQVTHRRDGEIERTPPRSRHRAESAGSSAPPSQHKTAKTTRSSKQPERPDRSSKHLEREDRRGSPSRRPDHPERSSRDPDDKTTRLEKELREMRKQMGDMKNSLRAKAARNLDNLVHRADSPFIPSIADFPLPSRFKVPLLENFDGTKDPFDYLEAFKTIMQLQAVPEEVMCRAFPLGLKGSARVWFNKLESESIGSFVQLSRAFIDHFIGSQRRGRPPTHLLSVKQMEGESLRAFIHRFNEEAMKIDRPKEDVTVTAFMACLRKGDFLYELCKDPLETMSELMYEATKHMNAEDALEAMDDPPPKRRKEVEVRKLEPAKQKVPKFTETPERKQTTAPPVKFNSFTPLNTPIDKLLLQIQDDPSLRWPGKIHSDPNNRPKNLYCRFHRDHGHLTEDCIALKEQVETLIRQGKLQKYVSRPANARPTKPLAQKEQAEHNRPGPVGEIRTIIGGPASGGTSRASRKAYARQVHNIMVVQRPPKNVRLDDQIISFSEEDARGTHQPHDDALVITINIAGFTTRRVMVDNGSSADILYLPAYQQMRLDKDKLRPMDAPLVGFTGDKVCPVGIVTLPITVAVTSTYHLLLKFPTEHGIGEVRGDQIAARECYLASLGSGGQNQTMSIEEQKILVKPSGELDTIELEDGRPERTTKIGADLSPEMKESLVQFLKDNKDVFAWSHEDMPGINPSIISHKLNVDPSLRPIKQKRRVFAPERNNAIMEEGGQTPGSKLHQGSYNQIVMDENDQEKTSFITSRGLICYKVMPFGLKNAGATYQRLMNRMFHDQIGRNVEVYVDDMLVKSKEEDDHLDDLRETFQTLRKYQMKLNPSKCAFGVYSGKFLGFMVSQRGIEANPDKIKAILEMQPPKEHQRSPKTDGKSSCIEPIHVSIHRQMPTLFQNIEEGQENYRPYFQAHTIVLLTNHPLRKAMNKPDAAGRLIQWSIELSEFDIDYRPRTAIKAQALADFIAEFTSKDDEPTEDIERTLRWTMNIDGSSTKDSGGIGVVLKSPEGDTIKQAVRLQYPTTNNEAEYEALLTGLEMAKALGATELDVLSDSQLVVGQVNGDYEAKEGRMQRYLHQERDATRQPTRSQTIKGTRLTFSHVAGNIIQERFLPPLSQMPGTRRGQLRHEREYTKEFAATTQAHGLYKERSRQLKFLVVAIDYFTKWVEAEPLATITERNIQNFVWKAVICRFGIPRVLVSDNGKQFDNPRFRQFSQELGIHNHYSSPGHPQANGQVEVTNRSLLKLIKTRLEGAKGLWPEELPSILWAYRTTVRIPTGETPFRMTFGSEAVVPVEIGLTTFRTSAYDGQENEEQLRLNLDLIDEVRETAEARMKRYQEKMARHYNSRVKPRQLSIGDLVLRKVTLATRNPSEGKLGPNWEGPYKVIEVRRPGTYHLEDMNGRRLPHPWNAEHLRRILSLKRDKPCKE
uniref:Uncharacterized protein n=1 Tax=Fagus sylvatica TaxID=28930 RepID=A0A2N9FNL6_FAGSY